MKFSNPFYLLISALLLGATPAMAADPVQQQNSNAVWFENWIGLTNATLTVSAPNGKITEVFTASGTPVFQLEGRDVLDGVYRYEMKAATEKTEKIVNQIDNGRGDAAKDFVNVPYYLAGHFVVSRGVIIKPKEIKEDDG